MQATALAAQPSAKVPAPARLVQIAVTAVERQPEVAYPFARLLSVQVGSLVQAQLSLLLGGRTAPAVLASLHGMQLSLRACGYLGERLLWAATLSGSWGCRPHASQCQIREQWRFSLKLLRTRPQAALDEQGTAAALQIFVELTAQIRALCPVACAAVVREMGEEPDGKVARRVGATAHLLALLLHSLAEQDDNDVLGDPGVLSGAPPRPQEAKGPAGRHLQDFHCACYRL